MKTSNKDIEGHTRLQFKSDPEASKAYQKVKKMLKKIADDDSGVLVLTGRILIIPQSLDFRPANAVML